MDWRPATTVALALLGDATGVGDIPSFPGDPVGCGDPLGVVGWMHRLRCAVVDSEGLDKMARTAARTWGRARNPHRAPHTENHRTRPGRVDNRMLRPENEHTQGSQAHQTRNSRCR